MDTRVVAETPDLGLAVTFKQLLVDAGIEAEMASEGGASVMPGISAGAYAVVVSAADYERAVAILDEAEDLDASAEAEAAEAEGEAEAVDPYGDEA
jgi:hypothetical protein